MMNELVTKWNTLKEQTSFNTLINELKPMILHLCKHKNHGTRDDLIQESYLTVLEACKTFDSKISENFKSYVHFKIKHTIFHYLRQSRVVPTSSKSWHSSSLYGSVTPCSYSEVVNLAAHKRVSYTSALTYALMNSSVSYDNLKQVKNKSDLAALGTIFQSEDNIDSNVLMEEIITYAKSVVKPSHLEIFLKNILEGYTNVEIAQQLGISPQRINQIMKGVSKTLTARFA